MHLNWNLIKWDALSIKHYESLLQHDFTQIAINYSKPTKRAQNAIKVILDYSKAANASFLIIF